MITTEDLMKATALRDGFCTLMPMMLCAGVHGGGYVITQSIRFNDDDNAHLYRTFGTPDSQQTWSMSFWLKRNSFSTQQTIFGNNSNDDGWLYFNTADKLEMQKASGTLLFRTRQVFRDPTAWYHIAVTNSTGSVARVYVNGVEVTVFDNDSRSGYTFSTAFGATRHNICRRFSNNNYGDLYLADFHFIDGQQLPVTDFGEFDSNGAWIAKEYTGSYGGNGFRLDGAIASDFGNDVSGNANHFTSSGLTAADQVTDSPSDDAANGVGNYCTWNPLTLNVHGATGGVLSDGNLKADPPTEGTVTGTMAVNTGKWYFEGTVNTINGADNILFGVVEDNCWLKNDLHDSGSASGLNLGGKAYMYVSDGQKINDSAKSSYGSSYTTNDVVSVALDLDNGAIYFRKNGTWQNGGDPTSGASKTGAAFTWTPSGEGWTTGFHTWSWQAQEITLNCGQSGFTYSAPTGYTSLNTANLPAPAVTDGSEHFQTTLYTGDASNGRAIDIGEDWTPGLVWVKDRTTGGASNRHVLYDEVRASNVTLYSDGTDAEVASSLISAVGVGSFTVNNTSHTNASGDDYVAWSWKANGSGSSDSTGNITVTRSTNTAAGFSILAGTGNSGAGANFGHGLSAAPKLAIFKNRDTLQTWYVGYEEHYATEHVMHLDTSAAKSVQSAIFGSPSSSQFYLDGGGVNSGSDNWIAYLWESVDGFSAFGTYTGNGNADGTFVHTGFRPAFVLIKEASASGSNWHIFDTARDAYNAGGEFLAPNTTDADFSGTYIDTLSNGFKWRTTAGSMNASGSTYLYAAFAERPFGGAGVAQARAR